ncbi:MAG TPA: hypothetical protein VNL98_06835 [Gemmatimonadales bacterium]|nr:hypothetical protein [Gemmatimonadales bacterium]
MFAIPGEVLWPTAAIGTLIALVFGGVATLRMLPRSRGARELDRETLNELHDRVDQLDQLQRRVSELEERVDFAERMLARQREPEQPRLPQGWPPEQSPEDKS